MFWYRRYNLYMNFRFYTVYRHKRMTPPNAVNTFAFFVQFTAPFAEHESYPNRTVYCFS